jgi:sarcosine/dimethylglycine N-methyltransferase
MNWPAGLRSQTDREWQIFCAGLGGTVRYLAHKYGAKVTGIELTPSRVSGAQELIKRVGLQDEARVIEGNVMSVPLADATMDAVVSQEAFCHVPDPAKALSEAFRILRSVSDYRRLVEGAGFKIHSATDLTGEWGPILKERLAMYQRLREETRQAGTPMGHDTFHGSYIRFVELIQLRKMGGVRIVASK